MILLLQTYFNPVISAQGDLLGEMDVGRVGLGVLDEELVSVGDGGGLAACIAHSSHWLASDTQRLVHSQRYREFLIGGHIRQFRLEKVHK